MTKGEVTGLILAAKRSKQLTWERIAEILGTSPVWTTSACLGQNSMSAEQAAGLCALLDLPRAAAIALQEFPSKGAEKAVPTDPLIYRFHEIVQVYGTTLKALIQEKFGDGIMSAIDFTMYIDKVPDPKGDRVKITMTGKFLPYKTW
jgi:cyanate lyase